MEQSKNRPLKLGLALGGGSARGLTHIGVLKVLHKHKIYPNYIAGTSMGSVIGAIYAAGYTPEEIAELAKTTNWKEIIDFTVPKSGLIKGELIERKIRKLVRGKKFKELETPLRVVSYNLDLHERVVFSQGDVARAVRASISIPGIFAPIKIGRHRYIDGGVSDPTPVEVVKEMGADVIIAIDLFNMEKTVRGPVVHEQGLMKELQEAFIAEELLNIKNYLIPERWPDFLRTILSKTFELILYPARVLSIATKQQLPPITKIMYETVNILTDNLAREKMAHSIADINIAPPFDKNDWSRFDRVDYFIELGEKAMSSKINQLKKRLKNKQC